MIRRPFTLLAAILLLGVGTASSPFAQTAGVPGLASVIAPAPSSEYGRGADVPPSNAIPAPSLPAPSNSGPVTGYGPGGMEASPGSSPNPPYIEQGAAPPPVHAPSAKSN